jgi:hypothetical protein
MMVLLEISVECPAKIAMTALLNGSAAMSLLPNRDLQRSHSSRYARPAHSLITKRSFAFVSDRRGHPVWTATAQKISSSGLQTQKICCCNAICGNRLFFRRCGRG